ncbi:MAG: sulfate transporter CysZ [Methylococcales bacterium]|nr:sulfate transporter CysZ [Methylococcales bacterium]
MSFSQKGNNPFFVISCLLKGLGFLLKPQLRKFLVIPILINFLLYGIAIGLAYFYMDGILDALLPQWLKSIAWLSGILILIKGLIFIVSLVIYFFTFTLLANLIASPFYDKLSEHTLKLLIENNNTGEMLENYADPSWIENLKAEWQHIRYLLCWLIFLVIFSMIPVINIIAPILWVLWGAWGIGLEYLAYPLANRGLLFSEQKNLAKTVRFGILTFGSITVLGLTIPFINILVSPVAVIAITIYTHGIRQKKVS